MFGARTSLTSLTVMVLSSVSLRLAELPNVLLDDEGRRGGYIGRFLLCFSKIRSRPEYTRIMALTCYLGLHLAQNASNQS